MVDKSVSNLRRALDSMLSKIEVKIDSTEKALGATLQRLDLDGDGVVDAHELREAMLGVIYIQYSILCYNIILHIVVI